MAQAPAAPAPVTPGAPALPKPPPVDEAKAKAFSELCQKVQRDVGGVTEQDVLQLLAMSRELSRPFAANLAVKSYFGRHMKPSPGLLLPAADNALLAGDYRTAIARYKGYLRDAAPSPEASEAAAKLYTALLDYAGDADDAYDTIGKLGDKFHQSVSARRFDMWYIAEARRRANPVGVANRLATVLADALPPEQEKLYYWDDLDWLLNTISSGAATQYEALPAVKKLATVIRESPPRTLRMALCAANLEYKATAAGKDEPTLDKSFAPVIASANAYFAALPTADTLREINTVFTGGTGTFSDPEWNRQAGLKRDFFVASFAKLPDPEKILAVNMVIQGVPMATRIATPEQWSALGIQFPAALKAAEGTRQIAFNVRPDDPTLFAKQAAFLGGVASVSAATINTLAAGTADINAGIKPLLVNDTWYLSSFVEPWQIFSGRVGPTFLAFPRDEKAKLADTYWPKAILNFGVEASKTPLVIFDREAAKNYLLYAFSNSGDTVNDKSKVAAHLHALDWVPYNAVERKEVVGPAYEAFKAWAGTMRTGADAAKKAVDDTTKVVAETTAKIAADTAKKAAAKPEEQAPIAAVIASDTAVLETQKKALADAQAAFKPFATVGADLTALEKEFAAVSDPKITDLNKAPDPLSRKLADCVAAVNAKKLDEFLKSGREAYALVREWDTKRVPFGAAAMGWLAATRLEAFDTFDLQTEILVDQIARLNGNASDPRIAALTVAMFTGRSGWAWYTFPAADAPKVRKLNATFNTLLTAQAQKGPINTTLFEWFRGTRRGAGWSDAKAGEDLLSLLIEKKTLVTQADYRIHPSGAATYMWLVTNEFAGLSTKYPVQTYFDAMFLEEANASKYLDWSYFNYGRDDKKAITNGAAKLMGDMAALPLPLGYHGEKMVWSRDLIANWISRGSGADKPDRDAMYQKIEAAFGKTRFDDAASGRSYFSFDADARTPEVRKTYFDRVAAFTDRIAALPYRATPPVLSPAGGIEPKTLTEAEFNTLWSMFVKTSPQSWPGGWGFEANALAVQDGLRARGKTAELLSFIPIVWKVQKDIRNPDMLRAMVAFARDLGEKGEAELATVYASAGLDIMGTTLAEDTRTGLMGVRARALASVGGTIAVPRSDPRYAIFAAQSDFLTGKFQSAWEGYQSNHGMVLSTFKDLDPAFVIWLIDRNTDARSYDTGEALGRQLLTWIEATPTGFDPEVRAGAVMSYANIAFARQEYPRARAQFERVASAPEFEGTDSKRTAELRIAEVDRVTRQFDKALERLQKLTRRRDKIIQSEAFYQMAMVKYDQEDYQGSMEYLVQTFSITPSHTNGRILEGKLNLKIKKLMEATQLKVGLTANQNFIVPGQILKIDLEDRDLAVVGSSTSIEVRVWTDTGDEEYFSLFPFGDSKTKFEGQIPTTLGVPTKNDRVLQVFGNSTVFFELSRRGKPQAAAEKPVSLTIASDAELHASSGRILTKQEMEERALENMIRDKLKMNASYQERLAMSTVRAEDEVKPGNPLYLRVIDPARSISPDKNTVKVRVTTSSGDVIEGFPLTETAPFSGVFEGQVPTSSGQASAGASDSDEGVSPNFPISAGKYGPWVGLPDNRRPKSFSVDLNDNVTLGKMTMMAGVPGRKLKEFALQTSLNGKNFNTVATWPKPSEAWDGSPAVDVVRYVGMGRAPTTLADFERYMDETYISKGVRRVTAKAKNVSANWDADLGGLGTQMGLAGGEYYIAHFYAAFNLPKNQFKTFQVDTKAKNANISYLLAIDGVVNEDPRKVAKSLSSGVHRIDLYVYALREAAPNFELMNDIVESPFIAPTNPAMFDPAKSPEIKEAVYSAPAKIEVDAASSQFDVTFAPDAHARVVRLLISDFETDAPAISSIKLTNAKGDVVLPTAKDFMDLRRNNVLEIVPGDKITIAYETPTPLTRGKGIYENFLHATYSDADVSACFVNYSMAGTTRKAEYVPLRRFRTGDPVSVFIKDPDEDVTDKQDTIKVAVKSPGGTEIVVNAVETDKHSGVFMGTFFPVSTAPARPTEIQLKPEEDLVISYLDKENTNPGIPWLRTHRIEQASYSPPMARVYNVSSVALDEDQRKTANGAAAGTARTTVERFEITRSLVAARPDRPVSGEPSSMILGGPLIVEISAPFLALSPQSVAEIYVQTTAGRKAAGLPVGPATTRPAATQPEEEPFDPSAPGTIKVLARPKELVTIDTPPGYHQVLVNHPTADSALDDGRFMALIPIKLGKLPEKSLADEPEPTNPREEKTPLFVSGSDQVYIGFKYKGPDGKEKWTTRRVNLRSDVLFDVTDRHFQESVSEAHVGEKFYLRIVEPVKDVSDDKDIVKVNVTTTSGVKRTFDLTESFGHSGIFKGLIELVYAGEQKEGGAPDPTKLPVAYGDVVKLSYPYTDSEGKTAVAERSVTVFKGADGRIVPFTKRFKDPNIAVQTQFTIAEAFFELAKKHRDLGQESLSRREIAQGKKLLEEAIRDYPETTFRAQADYLLANLSAEYAKDAQDPAVKKRYQMDAVTRFGDIVSSFPEGPYAPKAQYKKALVLEQMGEIDQACEEYVKLSYRYPDNELVAETIARLGQYFLTKGKEFEEKAQTQTEPIEREKVRIQGRDMFRTAAQVFGRLGVRFPQHHLAGRTSVLSAQAYMRAEDFDKAVEVFKGIIEDTKAEKDLVATSMYWCGDCYMKKNDLVLAYRMFKRVTWDYPESQWAKFARGRLTDEKLVKIEEDEANKR
ncbi:MAG: tetratricopeptide repeat protein [Planctomycetota bacterium]|nr:tetratricopeptide repeat protein [Planctomycetota bacterium]